MFISYEGVSVNVELIKEMSLDEFVNHRSYQHFWPELSEAKRKEYLAELYFICHVL